MASTTTAVITITSLVLLLHSVNGACNRYFFQEFTSYPLSLLPYFACNKEDSSSLCASKCISNAPGCSSFVLDFARRLCYLIIFKSATPSYSSQRHSYIHCSTTACSECKGFIFKPSATIRSDTANATTQQLESGWCANATRATSSSAAFSVQKNGGANVCNIISNDWIIENSTDENAYYPCAARNFTNPPRPPPASLVPPLPPFSLLNSSPPPPSSLSSNLPLSFCTSKADGSYADPLGIPACKYFYICGAGQVLLYDACPSPLIYGTNINACDTPGYATCNSTQFSPPPPPLPAGLNFTSGLQLNSTADAIRVGTQSHLNPKSRYSTLDEMRLPNSVNWAYIFGSSVRAQQSCRGCWAYATVDAIQSAQMIASGLTALLYFGGPLSVQQLLSCSGSLSSCDGGWPEDALEYASTVGTLYTQSSWPGHSCSSVNTAGLLALSPVLSWERVPPNDPMALKKAVANQPVIVGISTQGNLRLWKSNGIYNGSYLGQDCSLQTVDHNVLIVGYGDGYWLARNSWGSQWGDNGYFKIKMTTAKDSGVCNMLAVSPVYPVVSPANIVVDILHRILLTPEDNAESDIVSVPEAPRRQLASQACNGYYFQPFVSYTYNTTAFYKCNSTDSNTQCASKCILNAPGCINFVLNTKASSCHAVVDFRPTSNASMHAYLLCLDSRCSYCQGFRFLQRAQLLPVSTTRVTQSSNLSTCAASCLSSNCTSFSMSQSGTTCQLIYEKANTTNSTTFNSYSICLWGAESVNRNGSSNASLDIYCPNMASLCGAGSCVLDLSAPGGYNCQCPEGMVASVDSSSLPVCVIVDVCTGDTYNPCGIGTCINTGNGGYNCSCPSGFFPEFDAQDSLTCISKVQYALTDVGYYMGVSSTQNCNNVAASTGLGVRTLAAMNDMANCSQYSGMQVVVGPSVDSGLDKCGMLYQLSSKKDSCATVKSMFGLSNQQFAALNPKICNMTSNVCDCQPRASVCVEAGQLTAVGYPCSSYDTILQNDTCSGIIKRNNMSAHSFFMLNPGIDCDVLNTGDLICNSPFIPDYVTDYQSRRKLMGKCPCKYGCFLVRRGNTCFNLANTYYHCSMRLLQYWNGLASKGFICSNKRLIPGRTTLCFPQCPGGC